VKNMPAKVKGVCDKCGGPLYTRPDDSLESITNRLDVYRKQTEPLIAYYGKKSLLKNIDSSKSPEDTLAQIRAALKKLA
jgi:adenylate kinase